MDINKQYVSQPAEDSRENSPLLPRNLRVLVIGKSGCGKTTAIFNLLLQPSWLDYNHLYVFGKSLHQQEYKILRKRLDARLSKQHNSNLFSRKRALRTANLSPLTVIERFSGVRNGRDGKIRADFYDDCQDIPDPSALRKGICCCWTIASLASRIKPTRIILEVDTTTAIRYTLLKTISVCLDILFPQDVKNLTHPC